jgi:hypothetical protein
MLKIRHFRGVFTRDTLPAYPLLKESMVVNLDSANNKGGTHWVCCRKENDESVEFFDSFGFQPPSELIVYWRRRNPLIQILYNCDQNQSMNENICGHLCLNFLSL